jgi:hypothetical protein
MEALTSFTAEQKLLAVSLVGLLLFTGFGNVLLNRESQSSEGALTHLMRILGAFIPRQLLFWRRKRGIYFGSQFLLNDDRMRHVHIVGASGSGKSEALKALLFADIQAGRGAFVIDAKGDRSLYDEVRGFCVKNGREKDLFLLSATHPAESASWNPCSLGDRAELQSKFYNSNLFTEAYYAKACEAALLQAFSHLVEKHKTDSFGLRNLVEELNFLSRQSSTSKGDPIQGLFYDFANLADGEWGPILGSAQDGVVRPEINMMDLVQKNKILFVDLPTEGRSVQSTRMGRLLTQELILVSGLKKTRPSLNRGLPFAVYIDEFDAFATESFVSFLNKGRSSRFMIHIAHQTLSDLKRISPTFAGQILGLCNVHLVFRQDDPDDADYWSRFFGTRKVTKRTYQTQDGQTTGASSNREVQEFNVGPDRIRTFQVGVCALSIKNASVLRILKAPLPKSYSRFAKPIAGEPPISDRSGMPKIPSSRLNELAAAEVDGNQTSASKTKASVKPKRAPRATPTPKGEPGKISTPDSEKNTLFDLLATSDAKEAPLHWSQTHQLRKENKNV